jgi:uncharacterized protein YlbG (UPF0298 family)
MPLATNCNEPKFCDMNRMAQLVYVKYVRCVKNPSMKKECQKEYNREIQDLAHRYH